MMLLSVVVCIASFVGVVAFLRTKRISLGLPIAYLGSLLLIHVPGAVVHLLDSNGLLVSGRKVTEIGIQLTALGTVCFLIGVVLAHWREEVPDPRPANRTSFARFCLLGGAAATVIAFIIRVPSVYAVVERGGPIWMLAVMLGLLASLRIGNTRLTWQWIGILMLYPALTLVFRGFMSYGVAGSITVLSALVVAARSRFRVVAGCIIATVVGISIFLGYFENRGAIRGAVWGGASVDRRVDVSLDALREVKLFDPRNPSHLYAVDLRLNQNTFVGLAAARIEMGQSDYLYGRSIRDGALALVPRVFWPDKPIVAGSGRIVANMTGLDLDPNTSFGVGNVMEFHINFGVPGIIVGFILLGLVIGKLDRRAAAADVRGELGRSIMFFLPAVAVIQPNGSMVEMLGGAAAAVIAAAGWRWAWERWPKPVPYSHLSRMPQTRRAL